MIKRCPGTLPTRVHRPSGRTMTPKAVFTLSAGLLARDQGGFTMSDYIRWLRSHVGHAPLLLVGAGAIIYRDGKVLLQRRVDDGTWAIHGGCLEPGESTEETAIREIQEELGITPISLEFFSVVSGKDMFYRYPNGDEAYIVSVTYFCDRFAGEIALDPTEVKEVQWFDVDSLPENIHSPVDAAILKALKGFLIKTGRRTPSSSAKGTHG